MEFYLRKDSNSNWHFDDVKSGSKREQLLCHLLASHYLHADLVSNTPNFLVESAIRHRFIPYTSKLLPGVISFLPDGHIMFIFDSH